MCHYMKTDMKFLKSKHISAKVYSLPQVKIIFILKRKLHLTMLQKNYILPLDNFGHVEKKPCFCICQSKVLINSELQHYTMICQESINSGSLYPSFCSLYLFYLLYSFVIFSSFFAPLFCFFASLSLCLLPLSISPFCLFILLFFSHNCFAPMDSLSLLCSES